MNRTGWMVAVLAFALAACGTPESECREGVQQMKTRTESLVGFNQPEDVRRALEEVNNAETRLATGNYEGCLESLVEARTFLRKSQRTNQQ